MAIEVNTKPDWIFTDDQIFSSSNEHLIDQIDLAIYEPP